MMMVVLQHVVACQSYEGLGREQTLGGQGVGACSRSNRNNGGSSSRNMHALTWACCHSQAHKQPEVLFSASNDHGTLPQQKH
jgi:hypothetical protein